MRTVVVQLEEICLPPVHVRADRMHGLPRMQHVLPSSVFLRKVSGHGSLWRMQNPSTVPMLTSPLRSCEELLGASVRGGTVTSIGLLQAGPWFQQIVLQVTLPQALHALRGTLSPTLLC